MVTVAFTGIAPVGDRLDTDTTIFAAGWPDNLPKSTYVLLERAANHFNTAPALIVRSGCQSS